MSENLDRFLIYQSIRLDSRFIIRNTDNLTNISHVTQHVQPTMTSCVENILYTVQSLYYL